MTHLSSNIRGIFLSFQVLKHPDKKFRIGQALKATVVNPDSSKAFLCLSLIGVVMNGACSGKGGVERSGKGSSVVAQVEGCLQYWRPQKA